VNVLILIYSPFTMWNIPRAHVDRLEGEFPLHRFLRAADDREGLALIDSAEVAFSSQISREQLAAATRLRWIHSQAAGVGGMLYPEMRRSPVIITNSRGMAADTMAEHAIGVTLAMFRRFHLAVRRQLERSWAQNEVSRAPVNRAIAGACVLIVGLGAIGTAAAIRFAALGAHVIGVRRRPRQDTHPSVSEVVGPEKLRDLLPRADVVLIAAPETRATAHLIGRPELAAMKRDALLVNVSRGGLVDEPALIEVLESGSIGGAALDVFEQEPLPADSPLWTLPNVLITPHTSGFRPDHWDAATALFAENLRRFEAGQPLLNVVDKDAGY
jgi:phosphoglycerate dehydrogenase-like enzyme